MNVTLRSYQLAVVEAILRAARAGSRRLLFQLPTGCGKTETFAELCRLAKFPMVIAPQLAPMEQAKERLELRLGEKCDVEQGSRYVDAVGSLYDGRRRVIVASRDSLLSGGRYKLPAFDRVTLVVVDECHLGITTAFERVLTYYEQRGAVIVGCSATPYKGRGKPLRYWPRPTFAYSLREALDDEYLAHPQVFLSEAQAYDMRGVECVAGDWNQSQLEQVVMQEKAAHAVRSLVMETYRKEPSVVYATSVNHAKLLADVLGRTGVQVALLHSHQSAPVQQDNLKAFVSGEATVIVNVGILGMGWDHPELRNIYLAAPSRSLSRLEQRIGRGTRLLAGTLQAGMTLEERRAARLASAKPFFRVYDITGTVSDHQLASVYDILDTKLDKNPARRGRLLQTQTMDGVDVMAEIQKVDAEEAAAAQAKADEFRRKRSQLLIGVTLDHTAHDLFLSPDAPKKRGWHMQWGKWKGIHLSDVPSGVLRSAIASQKKVTPFVQGMQKELSRREASSRRESA